jgi:hypothetical protein
MRINRAALRQAGKSFFIVIAWVVGMFAGPLLFGLFASLVAGLCNGVLSAIPDHPWIGGVVILIAFLAAFVFLYIDKSTGLTE